MEKFSLMRTVTKPQMEVGYKFDLPTERFGAIKELHRLQKNLVQLMRNQIGHTYPTSVGDLVVTRLGKLKDIVDGWIADGVCFVDIITREVEGFEIVTDIVTLITRD